MPAEFYEHDVEVDLDDKKKLSDFLDATVNKHKSNIESIDLTYIFCSDEYLININTKFLDHDTYTDIITFDLSEDEAHLMSEIYISAERVAENAENFGNSFLNELHRVIFHGALHLCGFKDKTEEEAAIMRKMEEHCLAEYFKHED